MSGVLSSASVTWPPAYQVANVQVIGAAVVAALMLLVRTVGYATTVAHEGGHALLGSFFGIPIEGIRFDSPGNAGTTFGQGLAGLAFVITALAGHLGPSGFGLLAAVLLHLGRPDAVLWIGLALLALFLLLARNVRAFLATIALGLLVIAALNTHDPATKAFAAVTWAWILLAGSVVDVLGLRSYRRELRRNGQKDTSSDAYQLRKATWVPAALWVLVFFIASMVALIYGGALLLGIPIHVPLGIRSPAPASSPSV
jgi:hypothetical protein